MTKVISIVITDDSRLSTFALKQRLVQEQNIQILEVLHSRQELRASKQLGEADILLCDLYLPEDKTSLATTQGTFDLLNELKLRYPELRMVMISDALEPALIQQAKDGNLNGFLHKSDDDMLEKLPQLLQSILNGEKFFPAVLVREPNLFAELSPNERRAILARYENPQLTSEELAPFLGMAHSTLRNTMTSVYRKLKVRNLHEAIHILREKGELR